MQKQFLQDLARREPHYAGILLNMRCPAGFEDLETRMLRAESNFRFGRNNGMFVQIRNWLARVTHNPRVASPTPAHQTRLAHHSQVRR